MRKILWLPISLIVFVVPSLALAHEKWFINYPIDTSVKPLLFTAWSSTNASMALVGFFGLLVALILHFALRPRPWTRHVRSVLARYSAWVPFALRTLTGVTLFTASFLGFVFAPDLAIFGLPLVASRVVLSIQLLVGLGLTVGVFPRFWSALGLMLYVVSLFVFTPLSVLMYLHFVGIFLYLLIIGDPSLPKVRGVKLFEGLGTLFGFAEAKPFAMAILRISAGLSFLLVGFWFKVYEPAYALEFLRIHHVNFIFNNNEMFVLCAGVTEMLFGLLLIFGLLPRLMGGLLIAFLTFTLGIFGIYELLGHLPIYAAAFAFLAVGGGERWSAELAKKLPSASAKK